MIVLFWHVQVHLIPVILHCPLGKYIMLTNHFFVNKLHAPYENFSLFRRNGEVTHIKIQNTGDFYDRSISTAVKNLQLYQSLCNSIWKMEDSCEKRMGKLLN